MYWTDLFDTRSEVTHENVNTKLRVYLLKHQTLILLNRPICSVVKSNMADVLSQFDVLVIFWTG